MQIHKVEANKDETGKYWVQCTEERKNRVETKKWLDAQWVFEFCQLFVEDGTESVNFLVQFVTDCPDLVPRGFHEYIAGLSSVDVAELFPGLSSQPVEETASPADQEKQSAEDCGHDHDSAKNYKEVEKVYYFLKDRRFSTCSCRKCGKYFATEANQGREDYKQKGHIPLPKNGKNTCYACTKFEPGTVLCYHMVCEPCFVNKMSSKKRPREAAGKGSTKKPKA